MAAGLTVEPIAHRLDLLQHPLELVLGARELAREPDDVAPAGETEVAQRQVERVA